MFQQIGVQLQVVSIKELLKFKFLLLSIKNVQSDQPINVQSDQQMQQDSLEKLAKQFNYCQNSKDALRNYIFNLNYQQFFYQQIAEVRAEIDRQRDKKLKLKNSLLQKIPKVVKKQNQERIVQCDKQITRFQQQLESLESKLAQEIEKWKHIHQRCNSCQYEQVQPFSFYYQDSLHCEYQQERSADFLCVNKKCIDKSAFICGDDSINCQCILDHFQCPRVITIPFIQKIVDKMNMNAKRQVLQYFQLKQIIYQQMLQNISKERNIVQQWYNQNTQQQQIKDKKAKLIVYGIDNSGKNTDCLQQKIYYGSIDYQLHSDCGCHPLIVTKQFFQFDSLKRKTIFKSIMDLYAGVIQFFQQKMAQTEEYKRTFALNKAESIIISKLMKQSQLFQRDCSKQVQKKQITGQIIYYSRAYIKGVNSHQKLDKANLRSKWINQVEQLFKRGVQGRLLQKSDLFNVQFPLRQVQKQQIFQIIQQIHFHLNMAIQTQVSITKKQQELYKDLQFCFQKAFTQRKMLRIQDQGQFQQVIYLRNLNQNPIKKLYIKGQLAHQIQNEVIVRKRKQKVRQIYIQLSQLPFTQHLAQKLGARFPKLEIFEEDLNREQFTRQFKQQNQFLAFGQSNANYIKYKSLAQEIKKHDFTDYFEQQMILRRLKKLKRLTIRICSKRFDQTIQTIYKYKNNLRSVQIQFQPQITRSFEFYNGQILKKLSKLKKDFTCLRVHNFQLIKSIDFFVNNKNLMFIEIINFTGLNSEFCKLISRNYKLLQSFHIVGPTDYTDKPDEQNFIVPILEIKTLKHLSIAKLIPRNWLKDQDQAKYFTNLQYFQIHNRPFIYCSETFTVLCKNAINLKYIDIRSNRIKGKQLICLKAAKNLQTLLCGGDNQINGFDIINLVKYCRKLNKLSIEGLDGSGYRGKVDSEQLIGIIQNTRLTHLNISKCKQIQPQCLSSLKNLKVLKICSHLAFKIQVNELIKSGVNVIELK